MIKNDRGSRTARDCEGGARNSLEMLHCDRAWREVGGCGIICARRVEGGERVVDNMS